jgi:hypothetical protein
MEYEDDQGIVRKKQGKTLPLKTFKILKLVSIGLFPLVYFLYSPLLILIALAYFLLYFAARSIEKKTNGNLKKEYRIAIPKFDSVLAGIVLVITAAGVLLSLTGGSMRGGMFEAKSDSEIRAEMEERGVSSSQINDMLSRMKNRDIGSSRLVRQLTNAGSLLTGEYVLFQSRSMGGGGRGGGNFSPPQSMSPPEGFSPPGGMELAGNIPFSMLFQSIAKAINTVLLALVCVAGLITLRMMRKLE